MRPCAAGVPRTPDSGRASSGGCRHRRPQVAGAERIGQVVLGRGLPGHGAGEVAAEAAKACRSVKGKLMQVVVRHRGCRRSATGACVGSARCDEMIAVRRGQAQVAVRNPPLNVAPVGARTELIPIELPTRLEPGVDEHLLHGHDLERAHDLVAGLGTRPGSARGRREAEESACGVGALGASGTEVVAAECDDVAKAKQELLARCFAPMSTRAPPVASFPMARCSLDLIVLGPPSSVTPYRFGDRVVEVAGLIVAVARCTGSTTPSP